MFLDPVRRIEESLNEIEQAMTNITPVGDRNFLIIQYLQLVTLIQIILAFTLIAKKSKASNGL